MLGACRETCAPYGWREQAPFSAMPHALAAREAGLTAPLTPATPSAWESLQGFVVCGRARGIDTRADRGEPPCTRKGLPKQGRSGFEIRLLRLQARRRRD
jgi:hypothetical protein